MWIVHIKKCILYWLRHPSYFQYVLLLCLLFSDNIWDSYHKLSTDKNFWYSSMFDIHIPLKLPRCLTRGASWPIHYYTYVPLNWRSKCIKSNQTVDVNLSISFQFKLICDQCENCIKWRRNINCNCLYNVHNIISNWYVIQF